MATVSDRAIEAVLDAATRDLTRTVPAVLALLDKVTPTPSHRATIAAVRGRWETDPGWRERAARFRPNPRMLRHIVVNWAYHGYLQGIKKREKVAERLGFTPPSFILLDPTEACNLRCKGCWAGKYEVHTLPWETVDRIISEAKELGIRWIVLSGGEPLAYKHLFDMLEKHQDVMFMAYTNGTLIDDKVADRLAELGNFSPSISLEGFEEETDWRRGPGVYQKVMAAMDRLRERGLIFGASVTVTSRNVKDLFSDAFIDHLIEKGVVYVWSFHYIPIGRDPDLSLMVTPEQRAWLYRRVRELRKTKPILIADFWNDGEVVGGCIAGGRHYVHINANGDVEPCAFAHFATANIKEMSLADALRSPLFAAYRARQPFHPNLIAPCPIIDHPQALRAMVAESGARPTHEGADNVLQPEVAARLDERAAAWLAQAEELWAEYHGGQGATNGKARGGERIAAETAAEAEHALAGR